MANTGPDDPTCSTISRCSCSSPGRSTGSDSGGTTSPASPVLSQTRLLTFPGSIATTNVDPGSASCSKPTTTSRPCETSSGRSRRDGVNGYQLSPAGLVLWGPMSAVLAVALAAGHAPELVC